jgi:thiamine-monophosphate kinase
LIRPETEPTVVTDDASPTLREVGEFAVIDRLVLDRRQPPGVSVGPGDDAAICATPDGNVVVTTDMLVEGRHFRLDWSSPHDVGRKAIAQNAADVAAMGARVTAFVVAFGAPPATEVAHAQQLADGLWDEAGRLGAGIVGGDLVSSPQWVVSVTALGDLEGRAPVLRGGARPGATIAIVGEIGRSGAGYALLHGGVAGFDELKRCHLVPHPPYQEGPRAARAGALAMTDVSDGLVADLRHIADASGVEMELFRSELQRDVAAVTDAAMATGKDPWTFVLSGGEDHALVGCFPDPILPSGWRAIGRVRAGMPAILLDGVKWEGPAGWQSFD